MKKYLLLFLFLALCSLATGELIDGPANVREDPSSKPIVSLEDRVEIRCGIARKGWFDICIDAEIDPDALTGSGDIKPHTILFRRGQIIGKTLKQVFPYEVGKKTNRLLPVSIVGSTFHKNIRPGVNVATDLLAIVNAKPMTTKQDLHLHMKRWGYDEFMSNEFFSSYLHYETDFGDSPEPRFILVFGPKELAGIIHLEDLSFRNIGSEPFVLNLSISMVGDCSDELRRNIFSLIGDALLSSG